MSSDLNGPPSNTKGTVILQYNSPDITVRPALPVAKARAHFPRPQLEAKPAIHSSADVSFGVIHRHLQVVEALRGVSKRMGRKTPLQVGQGGTVVISIMFMRCRKRDDLRTSASSMV